MRSKFFDKETHYHLGRPDHHPAVGEFLVVNFDASKTVLEIGAGNGLGTKLLAEIFAKVIAIEPVNNLANKGSHIFNQDHVELHTVPVEDAGNFEFDYLICFQATHWFYQSEKYQQFYAQAQKPVLEIFSRIVPINHRDFLSNLIKKHAIENSERGFDYPNTVIFESSYEIACTAEQTAHGLCSGAAFDHSSYDEILGEIEREVGNQPIKTLITTKVCEVN